MVPDGALVEVRGLTKHFSVRRGPLGWSTALVRAVDSISFTLPAGTTLGLVGDQQARGPGDGHRAHHALAHAAGELVGKRAEPLGGRGDAHRG